METKLYFLNQPGEQVENETDQEMALVVLSIAETLQL